MVFKWSAWRQGVHGVFRILNALTTHRCRSNRGRFTANTPIMVEGLLSSSTGSASALSRTSCSGDTTHTHTQKESRVGGRGGTLPRWHQWPILPSHTRSSSRRDLRDESTSTTSIRTSLPKPISREHWLVSHGKDDCRHHRGRYGRHGRHGRYHLHDHHEQWLVLCVQNHALILRSLIYQRCSISNAQPWWTI